jgi:hypothetical protein
VGKKEPLVFTLIRDEIIVSDIDYVGFVEPGIGLIKLNRFNRKAGEQVRDAIEKLMNQGLDGLILDLRGNPGGFLSTAIDVAGILELLGGTGADAIAFLGNDGGPATILLGDSAPVEDDITLTGGSGTNAYAKIGTDCPGCISDTTINGGASVTRFSRNSISRKRRPLSLSPVERPLDKPAGRSIVVRRIRVGGLAAAGRRLRRPESIPHEPAPGNAGVGNGYDGRIPHHIESIPYTLNIRGRIPGPGDTAVRPALVPLSVG